MTASASEAARQGPELGQRFAEGLEGKAAEFAALLPARLTAARKRQLALTIAAAEIGAVAASRAIAKSDPALSEEILASIRAVLLKAGGPQAA